MGAPFTGGKRTIIQRSANETICVPFQPSHVFDMLKQCEVALVVASEVEMVCGWRRLSIVLVYCSPESIRRPPTNLRGP
jgi:hypothetical protein